MKNMCDKTYNAVGLNGSEDMILSVWALEEQEFVLDLGKYGVKDAKRIYPNVVDNVNFDFKGGKLTLSFKEKYSAALFKLNK